ncbi:follicle-stimulating hormone receptor-like [Lates calcarifer]|uniref:Follicle-stimulating hormone receptor-like n=1 Tax=Lates calcarifer TaxID=8187 RepID=A0AAJ7QFD3_LATCA|nr:follicle-stimulating hormone receptor-like [Lates calcarifer]
MMSLIMLIIAVINMTTASVTGSQMDINPGVETCLAERFCYQLSFGATEIPSNISSNTKYLEVTQTQIRVIPQGAFTSLQHLRKLTILQNDMLESIGAFAFANLPQLTNIFISENVALERIESFAFSNLPELTEM